MAYPLVQHQIYNDVSQLTIYISAMFGLYSILELDSHGQASLKI